MMSAPNTPPQQVTVKISASPCEHCGALTDSLQFIFLTQGAMSIFSGCPDCFEKYLANRQAPVANASYVREEMLKMRLRQACELLTTPASYDEIEDFVDTMQQSWLK